MCNAFLMPKLSAQQKLTSLVKRSMHGLMPISVLLLPVYRPDIEFIVQG